MFKVLKYLKESKAAVAAIIALLILQAYCDLALPQFTADIVDIGIGQGGIEYAVPDCMREETLEKMPFLWMKKGKCCLGVLTRKRPMGFMSCQSKMRKR